MLPSTEESCEFPGTSTINQRFYSFRIQSVATLNWNLRCDTMRFLARLYTIRIP